MLCVPQYLWEIPFQSPSFTAVVVTGACWPQLWYLRCKSEHPSHTWLLGLGVPAGCRAGCDFQPQKKALSHCTQTLGPSTSGFSSPFSCDFCPGGICLFKSSVNNMKTVANLEWLLLREKMEKEKRKKKRQDNAILRPYFKSRQSLEAGSWVAIVSWRAECPGYPSMKFRWLSGSLCLEVEDAE